MYRVVNIMAFGDFAK